MRSLEQGSFVPSSFWASVAKGDPAGTNDEGDNESANHNRLSVRCSLIVGVLHAGSKRRQERKSTADDKHEATESSADPALLWCWGRNLLTLWLYVFWFHIQGALETPNW